MPTITGTLTLIGDSAALITPTGSQFIEVLSLSLIGKDTDATVTVKTGSTVRFTALSPATGVGGVSVASGHEPVFQGLPTEALKINLSAAGLVAYNINYSLRP